MTGTVILMFLLATVLICIVQLYRNSKIYSIRIYILYNFGVQYYGLLPSYSRMMWQWSMWTKESYINHYLYGGKYDQ